MSSSSNQPSDRLDSNFEVVIAFDYYDGPESGLAVYASGEGVRFLSIGDSESRFRRAFEMETIEGDWWPLVRELLLQEGGPTPRRVVVPSPSQTFTSLRDEVVRAKVKRQWVAVGTPDMSWLSISSLDSAALFKLRELGWSAKAFTYAKNLVRRRRRL